jgi:acetylornithine deacetylase/succinyl-diaminopimelate desuccinylase-like protein
MTDIADRWASNMLPILAKLVEIPAVSPGFDRGWSHNGHLRMAAEHTRDWISTHEGMTAEIIQIPGRTPLVFAEARGRGDGGTVVVYGHLDKQPPLGSGRPAYTRGGRSSATAGCTGGARPTTDTRDTPPSRPSR